MKQSKIETESKVAKKRVGEKERKREEANIPSPSEREGHREEKRLIHIRKMS